jgi:hypothetical protein
MADYLKITLPRLKLIKSPTTCEVCNESVRCALVVPVLGGKRTCFPCFNGLMEDKPSQAILDMPCPCGGGLRLKQCCLTRASAD